MTYTLPLDIEGLGKLPISTYWDMDAHMEYFHGGFFTDRLRFIRHLWVNEVPLYLLSLSIGLPNPRWIRSPFHTLEECLSMVAHERTKGRTISRVEVIPITELNKLHRTYDEDYNETVHEYTNWVHHFGGNYERTPNFVFEGLTEEHQERFLPQESRHLLTRNLDNL